MAPLGRTSPAASGTVDVARAISAIRAAAELGAMRLNVRVPAEEHLREFAPEAREKILAVLRRELNTLVDEADVRIAAGAVPVSLQRARDRAARACLTAETFVLHLETTGVVIRNADMEIAGRTELAAALERDAVRNLERALRRPLATLTDHAAAHTRAAEGTRNT